MKFANIKNEFKNIYIMWKKHLRCWSAGSMKGKQIVVHLPMDLQKALVKTDCTLLVK